MLAHALVTAGASLHWMDWEVVLPRRARLLTPDGCLAIIDQEMHATPWQMDLRQLIARFSTNQVYQPYDLVEEIQARGLFERYGVRRTAATPYRQSIAAYIEPFHSRNGFSRERMSQAAATAFDTAAAELVLPFCRSGMVELSIFGVVTWGRPTAGGLSP